jgi:NADH-ubiquinone oxidoreductase chain 5
VIGIITILIAGATALYEIDIKKVIALSTLSQLGVIITILGLNRPILAYFHLLRHAFFKAILFMCAGIVIHNIKDYQDIRKIRSILNNIPLVYSVIIVANLRLCGLPFLRGFYSKDLILEVILIKNLGIFMYIVILLATFLTVAYSCRIIFLLSSNFRKSEAFFIVRDKDKFIITGIIYLLLLSILGGIILS